jgi:acetyl esterase
VKSTFEQVVENTKAMHAQMRPVFNARPITGERIAIQREGKEPVDVIVYQPEQPIYEALPVFFNMHGGGFIGGDAVLMDSFCRMLSERLPAVVFNINYKKAPEYAFPYAIEEIYDTAVYAVEKAAEFNIDPRRMAVGGHSAGASLAASVALKAKEKGKISFACQILVYPCTDLGTDPVERNPDCSPEEAEEFRNFTALYCQHSEEHHRWVSPVLAEPNELTGVCPAVFITCELDSLRLQGEDYAKKLIDCGIPVAVKCFKGALHGFVEVNRPDYFHEDERKSPEQAALCHSAEEFIYTQLKAFLQLAVEK